MFQRTADSLGQVSRREEGLDEVLEDPEKIIAGFINFAENDNDFILYESVLFHVLGCFMFHSKFPMLLLLP